MYSEINKFLERARKGDIKAKREILERYKPLILSQMKRYYFDTNEREDLISEGNLVVLKGIDGFDPSKGVYFSGYLKTILGYYYLNRIKAKKSTSSLDKPMGEGNFSLLDLLEADVDIEEEYLKRELNDNLAEQIDKLSPRQREVVVLFYMENMNMHQISKRLGVTYRTIINTKVQAIEKLRKLI